MSLSAALALPAHFRPTVLDRMIGWVSPGAGLRRMAARAQLTRAYLAASPSDSWRPKRSTASANANHLADAPALRAKSRFLIENVDYISAGMNARVGMLVGTGIVPRWSGTDGDALARLWEEWVPMADADGQCDYYGLQALAVRAMDADGEVLIRLRVRRPEDGLPVPLQLQVLEVDWLDAVRDRNPDTGNVISQGKEYDMLGRCVAYWLYDAHPGDPVQRSGVRMQSNRVPADNIIHLFAPTRPGQRRGFPRLSPAIIRARDEQLLEDAELQRKNMEARLGVIASTDPASMENPLASGQPNPDPASLGPLAAGGITHVGVGQNITTIEPQAAPGFVDYCKHNIHLVCAGGGFTYEQATGDMKGVNFSSARIRQIDIRREVEQLQWHTLVPVLCRRVCRTFANLAAAAGLLSARAPAYTLEHSTPKWDYVDPGEEVDATLEEIGGGLTSFSEAARRRNDDPKVRRAELASDIAEFKSLGIWDDLLALRGGRGGQGPASAGASGGSKTAPKPTAAPKPP